MLPKRTAHRSVKRDDQLIHEFLSELRILRCDDSEPVGEFQRASLPLFLFIDGDIDVGVNVRVVNMSDCPHAGS